MKEHVIRISSDLALPADVATQSIGIVAQRGAGKSYLAAVLVEELVALGVPTCVLDPVGVFWGLRLGADGKKAGGLPVVILGGEHGDIPLTPDAGKAVAEWIVSERRPSVLDLSSFRKGEQRTFVTDLAEELYRRNRAPLHLVLDEADLFAPQRPMPGEQRMLGAFEDLVRRGRARGLGITLVTQRPAVLHKDVLTQVAALVAMRLVGPQDVKAVDGWIQSHGTADDRKRVLASLPALPVGEAWFWSPGWLGVLERIKVRKRKTFDSSRAPKVGERSRVSDVNLSPVDLLLLEGRLAAAVERAKADDPRELRKRIADLERAAKLAGKPAPIIERVEVPVFRKGEIGKLESILDEMRGILDIANVAAIARSARAARAPEAAQTRSAPPPEARSARSANGASEGNGAQKVGTGGLRRILVALAQRPQGLTAKQIGVRAGLSHRSGTFSTYLGRARSSGWVEGQGPGEALTITEAGIVALGAYEPLPTGRKLLAYWIGELGQSGASRLLSVVAEAYPSALDQDVAADRASLSPRSGTFSTYLGRLRNLELVTGRGQLRASEELFE